MSGFQEKRISKSDLEEMVMSGSQNEWICKSVMGEMGHVRIPEKMNLQV